MEIDLALNTDRRKNKDDEIKNFMKELENSLNDSNSLYNQIMKENELAPKYKEKIKGFIKEGMRDISHDYGEDFKYIEYNPESNNYIYDYSQGKFKRTKTTQEELQKNNLSVGNIYTINKNNKLERDLALEYQVKDDVDYALWDLED